MAKRGRLSDFIITSEKQQVAVPPPPPLPSATIVEAMEAHVRNTAKTKNCWSWTLFHDDDVCDVPELPGWELIYNWAETNCKDAVDAKQVQHHYNNICSALRDAWNAANPDVPGQWRGDGTFVIRYSAGESGVFRFDAEPVRVQATLNGDAMIDLHLLYAYGKRFWLLTELKEECSAFIPVLEKFARRRRDAKHSPLDESTNVLKGSEACDALQRVPAIATVLPHGGGAVLVWADDPKLIALGLRPPPK